MTFLWADLHSLSVKIGECSRDLLELVAGHRQLGQHLTIGRLDRDGVPAGRLVVIEVPQVAAVSGGQRLRSTHTGECSGTPVAVSRISIDQASTRLETPTQLAALGITTLRISVPDYPSGLLVREVDARPSSCSCACT